MILVLVMLLGLLSVSAFTVTDTTSSDSADTSYKYNIMFLDCGRKYYSVDSIKKIINNASAAGFNYIQLAVGNDGLRFLLNDMSLTVNGTTYTSKQVSDAIHAGNEKYGNEKNYDVAVDELTQSEMDTIIAYAGSKGMGVIPCVNTPGHMDAILGAATSLTGEDCAYSGSARTIDVTNGTAVAFTQALLQKYITYFAGKGCKLFNMGADEYANDIYTGGSMGFGNLQDTNKYSYYVNYVNAVDDMIQAAGMTAMAFNDGIYFKSNTSSGTFNTDIIVCYWSNGWGDYYTPMPASDLASKGFKLINTHGDYYWVLGKPDWQCSKTKASEFNYKQFQGSTISTPAGSMFCIWADYPGAETEKSVISKTADTIAAFGKALPTVNKVETVESKTVTQGDVAVTAPGLTDLTVTEATAPTIDTADEGKVSAYDVTPATENGSYAGRGSVSLPVPKGWDASRVRGYIVNDDSSVTTGLTGTTANGKFTFTVPHFSQMGIYELAANAATETKTINLTVGGTATDKLDGEYPGTKLDDAVASVVGGDPTDKPGTTTYEPATLGEGTFYVSTTANDTAPTVQLTFENAGNGQYYIRNSDGKYLYPTADYTGIYIWGSWGNYRVTTTNTKNEDAAVKVVTNNDGSIVISKTVKSEWSTTTAYLTLNGTSLGASENSTSLYLYDQQTTPGGKETTLTFTGKSVGTTKVTIGNTQYIINVTDEDLSTVTPLTVEYWITNRQVSADGVASKEIKATDSSVHSETGAKFSGLVPATGTQGDNTDVFWKGTRLTSANKQTNQSGVDQTRNGNDFAYIRYWNHKWSFSVDGKSWTDFNDGDQVVAYYLQKTTVTDEVKTEVADWGEVPHTNFTYSGGKFVLIDYAVKYQSGNRTPDAFPVNGKTIAFHCNYESPNDLGTTVIKDGNTYYRKIGTVRAEETEGYEVYMITVTPNSDTKTEPVAAQPQNANSYSYDGTEKVVWVDNEVDLGDFSDKNLQYEGFSVGGDPVVPGLKIYNKQAMLITYYVRAKVTTDSLHVHYIDKTSNQQFYSYPINVKSGTQFSSKIALNKANWKGPLVNGTVSNDLDKPQTVSADLSTMPEISAQNRYSQYTCDEVRRSDDGKDVYLYYTFDNTKTFVVDFGLPLEIYPQNMNTGLLNKVNSVAVEKTKLSYGTAQAMNSAENGYKVVYTMTKPIDGYETISITYTGVNSSSGKEGTATYNAYIIPASTVYYEDNFISFEDNDGKWEPEGKATTNAVQDLDALMAQKIYGYDSHYTSSSAFSLGSAMMTTVSSKTNSNPPKATFTFKGTGFDLVSMTSKDTGTILVDVDGTTENNETVTKRWIVDTFYGYKRDLDGYIQYNWTLDKDGKTWHNTAEKIPALPEGAKTGGTPNDGVTYEPNYIWTPAGEGDNALYQIPVIHYTDLPYGEYTVTVTPKYSRSRDPYYDANGDNNSYDFYLDGVRIYNPAGNKLNSQYVKDGEGYAQFTEIRNMLIAAKDLKSGTSASGVVFVDGVRDTSEITDYTNYGPNNEVYLSKGQAIAFKISDMSNVDTIQIGAKAPKGDTTMKIQGNGNAAQTQSLTTASDMYYKLENVQPGQTIVITNAGDNLLSLTTLKVTYKNQPSTSNSADPVVDEEVVAQAPVMLMSMLYGEPQTFEPEHFTAKWSRNVRKGGAATLTVKASADVESITVNGEEITAYTTKTERSFWGPKETYHVFTYRVTNAATADYTVCALNAEGVASDPITAPLTVRPSIRDWWNGIFDKWKH